MKIHFALMAGALAALSTYISKNLQNPFKDTPDFSTGKKIACDAVLLVLLIVVEIFKMKSFLTALANLKSWKCTLLAFFANITLSVL